MAVAARARGAAFGPGAEGIAEEGGESVPGSIAVAMLAAVLGGFDEDFAARQEAAVGMSEDALAQGVGDMEAVEVAAKLDGTGRGVDALPARTRRTHRRKAQRAGGDGKAGIDAQLFHDVYR